MEALVVSSTCTVCISNMQIRVMCETAANLMEAPMGWLTK